MMTGMLFVTAFVDFARSANSWIFPVLVILDVVMIIMATGFLRHINEPKTVIRVTSVKK